MDKDTENLNDDYLGQLAIKLNTLKDQAKHDQFHNLQGKDSNQKWQGMIHLGIQWIWSRVRHLEDTIFQKNENIEYDCEELRSLEEQLEKLFKPFEKLSHPNEWMLKDGVKTPRNSVLAIDRILRSKNFNDVAKEIIPLARKKSIGDFGIYSYVLLSILAMFSRPDLFNVISI